MVVNYIQMSATGRVVSILSGVAVFVIMLVLKIALQYALVAGVIGWLIAALVFLKKDSGDKVIVDSSTRSEIENTIKTGRRLTAGMRQAVRKLSQVEITQEVEDLCRIAESMFELLRKDPNDLRIVKQFITYYLEPTHKIIVKYVELATTRPMPADAVETLERTEKSLKSIRATFLQQKERMLTNDVMDLDTEIKVFETLSGNYSPVQKDKDKTSQTQSGI